MSTLVDESAEDAGAEHSASVGVVYRGGVSLVGGWQSGHQRLPRAAGRRNRQRRSSGVGASTKNQVVASTVCALTTSSNASASASRDPGGALLPVLPRSGLSGRMRSGSPGGCLTSTESIRTRRRGCRGATTSASGSGHQLGHAVSHALVGLRHRVHRDAGPAFYVLPDRFAGPFVVGDVRDAQ